MTWNAYAGIDVEAIGVLDLAIVVLMGRRTQKSHLAIDDQRDRLLSHLAQVLDIPVRLIVLDGDPDVRPRVVCRPIRTERKHPPRGRKRADGRQCRPSRQSGVLAEPRVQLAHGLLAP
jgi:hypothetical protein